MSPSIPIPAHDAPLSGGSPFPPIGDYAFLSDCHTGALIAPDGSIEWLCVPRFDSASVFGALLDRRAGSFRVGPYGLLVPLSVRYVPGTMMVETTWMTPSGWLIVHDVLTVGPWHQAHDDESSHTPAPDRPGRRPHADPDDRVHPRPRAGRGSMRADVRLRTDAGSMGDVQ